MYGSGYHGSEYYASGYYGASKTTKENPHTSLSVTATPARFQTFTPKDEVIPTGPEQYTALCLMATPSGLKVFTPKTAVYEPEGGPSDGAFLQDDEEVIMLVARAFLTLVN